MNHQQKESIVGVHVGAAAPACPDQAQRAERGGPVEQSSPAGRDLSLLKANSVRSSAVRQHLPQPADQTSRAAAVWESPARQCREGVPQTNRVRFSGRHPAERSSAARAPLTLITLVLVLCFQAFGQGMSQGVMSPPANVRPPYLQNVGIEQRLDGQVPPDLAFVDDAGHSVKLGDYFGKKPLILNLVYYNCTMLCGEVMSGLAATMKLVKFDVGKEFDVITVSFNPKEMPAIAAAKKQEYLKRYGRAGAAAGWHFLTGPADSINALTKAVGFQYQYDPRINQYAHATAIVVLTPEGRISRYFYGVDFPPKDLRLGLVEASQGKIGNPIDAVLLYCYHYDPVAGKYGAVVSNMLRVGAAVTILILGIMLLILFRLEKIAARRTWDNSAHASSSAGSSHARYVR